ncbi:MAG: polysaccharide deacetylase family protein [Motilibacteraceae bacterium]
MAELPVPTRDFVGYGRHVPVVQWPDGARLALNLAINYEEGSERSFDNGDERNEGLGEVTRAVDATARDLATESVYEYGSRAGVFRILRILDDFGVPATFFAAAVALERNPEVAGWIAEAGHDVCGHGYRWSEDWLVDRDEEARRIAAAYDSITRTTGRPPAGWYNRWMPSTHTRSLLVEHGGFSYDSNAYNDDLPYWTSVSGRSHLVVPYTLTYNDNRYVADGLSPSGFVDYCVRAIDELAEEGRAAPRMMSVGLHARWTGQPARASALRQVLAHAARRGDVWVARREDIATTFAEQVPPPAAG